MDLQEILEKATPRPWEVNYQLGRCSSIGKYGNGIVCVSPCGNKRDVDNFGNSAVLITRAVNNFEPMLTALREIAKCEAPFKRDPLDFANSVISKHVGLAEETIRQVEKSITG